jgi:hypothetical protein
MIKQKPELSLDDLNGVSGGDFLGGLSSMIALAAARLEGGTGHGAGGSIQQQGIGASSSKVNASLHRIESQLRPS